MSNCFVCGKFSKSACGDCRKIVYCGKECQNTHWQNGHDQECIIATPMIGSSVTNLAQALDPYTIMNILSKLPDNGILSFIQDIEDGLSEETVEYLSHSLFTNFWRDRYDQIGSRFYPKSETTAFGVWYKTALLRNYTSSINWADFPTNVKEKVLLIPVDLKDFLFALTGIFRTLQKSFPKFFDEDFFEALENKLHPLKLDMLRVDEQAPRYSIMIPIESDASWIESNVLVYLRNEKSGEVLGVFANVEESPASRGDTVWLAWPDDIIRKFVEMVVEMPKANTSSAARMENRKRLPLNNQDTEVIKTLGSFKLPAYQ